MPFISAADAKLYCEDVGSGNPPLLFVHGTGDDHQVFTNQITHFSRNNRIVAVDLRGHGRSDTPEESYTFERAADDLAELSSALDLRGFVLVGHSMGGTIGLELASRQPAALAALVLLDAPVLLSNHAIEAQRPAIEALQDPSLYEQVLTRAIQASFGLHDDPANLSMILEKNLAVPQHVIASIAQNGLAYIEHRIDDAIAKCNVPLLYISAGPGAPGLGVPPGPGLGAHVDFGKLHELCPQVVVGQTVGSGHRHQLEVPEQINAMISQFIATL